MFYRLFAVVVIAASLFWLSENLFGGGYDKLGRLKADHAALSADNARIASENAAMRQQIDRLTNDPAMIERVARDELGLVRNDETVFLVGEE